MSESHVAVVRELLEAGSHASATTGRCLLTPLHMACERDMVACVQILLSYGGAIQSADYHGETALHVAAECGHDDIVGLLLEAGANIFARRHDGLAALQLAFKFEHHAVVKKLLKAGAADITDLGGQSNCIPQDRIPENFCPMKFGSGCQTVSKRNAAPEALRKNMALLSRDTASSSEGDTTCTEDTERSSACCDGDLLNASSGPLILRLVATHHQQERHTSSLHPSTSSELAKKENIDVQAFMREGSTDQVGLKKASAEEKKTEAARTVYVQQLKKGFKR
uniref:Uncharacterized protein n=1 Tax=Heterosigma akashiwo TaxID=2829 RepID=A0A7S3UT58_HETAK